MIKKIKQILASMLAVIVFCAAIVPAAASDFRVNIDADCSLDLLYTDTQHLQDVRFLAYYIADVSENMEFSWKPTYEGYHLKLDSANPQSIALILASYISRDELSPAAIGLTDVEGRLRFDGLKTGMYLIVGESYSKGAHIYTPIPVIVSFPYAISNGKWLYAADIEVKYEQTSDERVSLKVLKVWDDGKSNSRPSSIDIQLLRDGKLWDTVTLDSKNNWKYRWNDLESGHNWYVIEREVPDGYTESVSKEGITFVITNTSEEPETPEEPESPKDPPKTPTPGTPPVVPPVNPSEPQPEIPINPPENVETPEPEIPPEKLPQTGMNWQPVLYLASSGIICLVIGLVLRRKGNKRQ